MASFIGSIEPYSRDYDFESYCERLEQLFLFNNVVEKKEVALFITCLGPTTYGILKDLLCPEEPSKKRMLN